MLKRYTSSLLALVIGCGAESGVIGEAELDVSTSDPEQVESAGMGGASEPQSEVTEADDSHEGSVTGEATVIDEATDVDENIAPDEATDVDAPDESPPLAETDMGSGGDTGSSQSAEAHMPCADATPISLPGVEIAERLSNLLFNAPPTPELLKQAEDGQLGTYGDVECAALEMVERPEVSGGLLAFLETWLRFDTWPYEPNPELDLEVWSEMQVQAAGYLMDFAESGDTTLEHLLTEKEADMFPLLAQHLGLDDLGELPARVTIPQQRGVLTLGLVTASLNRIGRRGRWVLQTMQCMQVPPKPAGLAPATFPEDVGFQESYLESVAQAVCAGCHSVFDDYGLALENFDVLGRLQTEEAGQPLLVSGEVMFDDNPNGSSESRSFVGPDEFMAALTASGKVRDCLAHTALHHSTGVALMEADPVDVARVRALFDDSGADLAQLLVAVTQADGFWD